MAERLREEPEKQGQTDSERHDEEDRRPPRFLLALSAHGLMLAAPHPPLRAALDDAKASKRYDVQDGQ
jgi:hypothetical protein